MPKVHLLSLGCPKNLADSEKLLDKLRGKGLYYSSNPEDSDMLMVNTCGFIEDAKRESIQEILRIAREKKGNGSRKLIVFGCLAQRFGEELRKEIPEIDMLWGVGDEDKIVEYCENNIPHSLSLLGPPFSKGGNLGGVGGDKVSAGEKLSDTPYAYLKIAEGCNRGCTYCAIPAIRGPYRSRRPEEILKDAEVLVTRGIKELIIIAQDITSYGKDIKGYDLSRLLREIASIEGDFWIRLLYLYPASVTDGLLETISSQKKICNYIDMPLQHSEERILKLMGRGGTRRHLEKLILKIRSLVPDVAIRTTFIAGFPQETEQDFESLVGFIREMEFDRLGVFPYSREEGTQAFSLKGHVPKKIRKERHDRIMELQSAISLQKNKKTIGKICRVLVDEDEGGGALARLYSHAPEIDGVVLIENERIRKGDFVDVKITEAFDYDLKGTVAK